MILTRADAARFLEKGDRFVILTHRRPDGDTVGSAAALCLGLRQMGKSAWVLHNPEVTSKYAPLLDGLAKPEAEEADTLICVDTASPNMLPEAFRTLENRISLRIDHHGSATSFTPMELVEPHTAACGEIIYELLVLLGVHLEKPIANALYTAVSTDTGCFRYANTTDHSFRVAAACAEGAADIFAINQALFETNTLARLRLQGWLVENALFLEEGKIAICALPLETEKAMGLTEDDMENISGFPRTIEGVRIAATLRQEKSGLVKLSVRAIPGYDAAAICAKFGGGGHKGAAGASLHLSMEEAVKAVAQAMPLME